MASKRFGVLVHQKASRRPTVKHSASLGLSCEVFSVKLMS